MSKNTIELTLPERRDADAETLVQQIISSGQPSLSDMGPEQGREYLESKAALASGPSMASVEDRRIDSAEASFDIRIYNAQSAAVPRPVVVYFHGGGWVVGSVAASDAFCRRLTAAAECVTVSVEYPLAPERPFPAAVNCATAALRWAADNLADLSALEAPLLVLGDSAGGNLATVAVRKLLEAGQSPVARQILAYPGTAAERDASRSGFADTWPLSAAERDWFLDQYVPDKSLRQHPDVAPLMADVSGMPHTSLLLGGCDLITPEGLAYANHLWAAGVPTDIHIFGGQIHGYLTLDDQVLPRSKEALGLVANIIRSV